MTFINHTIKEIILEVTAATFACFGYGWHIDVGIHAIHLVLSGIFDRYPKLNMIIGH